MPIQTQFPGTFFSQFIHYLLRDLFITPLSAGSVHNTAAEPGTDTRKVVDTESKLSISNRQLVLASRAVATWADPSLYYATTHTHAIGFGMLWKLTWTNNIIR